MISGAKTKGEISSVKMSASVYLTHLLIVDDVLLFGDRNLLEWMHYKSMIDLFCGATGMSINARKSVLHVHNLSQEYLNHIIHLFNFACKPLEEGLSYLGFRIKPNCYQTID